MTAAEARKFFSSENCPAEQGCQLVYFQTKNPNLGKFWRALEWKISVYFVVISNILRLFGIFYGHLVMLLYVHSYIFHRFGILCQDKSGIPAA
jgi:hypothetical protein